MMGLAAVSRQVSALEVSLGGALLLRTTRRVEVTEGGRRYYEQCLRVLGEVDAAQNSLRRSRVIEGVLVVTAPVTYGLARVSPHLPALIAKHRGLTIELRLEDRVIDLPREGVDVAIRTSTTASDSASLVERRLTAYRRVVVASPRYLKRRGEPRTPGALAKHDAIVHLGNEGRVNTWRFGSGGDAISVEVVGSLCSNAPYAMRHAALGGVGVAILPEWLAAEDVAAGRLRILLPEHELVPVMVSGVFRTEMRGAPRVRALLDHLEDAYNAPSMLRPARRSSR